MKNKVILFLSLILLGVFLFYWFQIRPPEIRSYCDRIAWDEATPGVNPSETRRERYNWKYMQCLHSQGLK